MKRSEAIKLINDRFNWDFLGKDVLNFIEEYIRMLPPAHKDPDLDGHRFGEVTYKNEWEPE